ncbi:MAG: DHH family phosphoesterase [Phycisphaeraceae bacterium]|nr:DHH family phosphoesterase [Phycisphaeraceae bacterium]
MSDYVSNLSREAAGALLVGSKRVVVTTHAKPDGDAYGAVIALTNALRRTGAETYACFMPPVHSSFRSLAGFDQAIVIEEVTQWPQADLYVIVDTGAWSQLLPARDFLTKRLDRTLILDHHLTGGVEAAHRYIDSHAASSCEIIAELIESIANQTEISIDTLLDPIVCEALFVGIASDTGWFRYSNTRPQTHELAAQLLRRGVDHAALFQKLEQTERPEKLQLLIRAVSSLRLISRDRAAVMVLHSNDFAETGSLIEETERFVDIPQMVESVQVVVLITEPPVEKDMPPGPVRLSFRSKPGPNAIDVTQIAGQFGGGGHARAAGAKIDAPLETVITRVTAALQDVLSKCR